MVKGHGFGFGLSAASYLREQADRLESCGEPAKLGPWKLDFSDLERGFEKIVPAIAEATADGDRCIYVFEMFEQTSINGLREIVSSIPKAPRSFAMARYNKDVLDGNTLYVGSSYSTKKRTYTVLSRIKQHLGLSNATTYAMHLNRWASGVPGSLSLTVYQFPEKTEREHILSIEDYLATQLHPLLGRRGRAN